MGNHCYYITCLLGHSCKLAKVLIYTLNFVLLAVESIHLVQDFLEYINSTRYIPDGRLAPTLSSVDLWLLLLFPYFAVFSKKILPCLCHFPSSKSYAVPIFKGGMLQWVTRSSPHSLCPSPIWPKPNFQYTLLSLRERETRFGWPVGKSTQKHSLGNKTKPLLSYLCPFQPWSSGGISPCTERKSCRWRQRLTSEHGHKCEDPCRSGTSVLTRAGFAWATLRSVLLQSYSVLC